MWAHHGHLPARSFCGSTVERAQGTSEAFIPHPRLDVSSVPQDPTTVAFSLSVLDRPGPHRVVEGGGLAAAPGRVRTTSHRHDWSDVRAVWMQQMASPEGLPAHNAWSRRWEQRWCVPALVSHAKPVPVKREGFDAVLRGGEEETVEKLLSVPLDHGGGETAAVFTLHARTLPHVRTTESQEAPSSVPHPTERCERRHGHGDIRRHWSRGPVAQDRLYDSTYLRRRRWMNHGTSISGRQWASRSMDARCTTMPLAASPESSCSHMLADLASTRGLRRSML